MKRLLPWLLAALVLRLIIIPTTLHPDIRGHNFAAFLISQKGELFTFYDHISKLPRTDPLVQLYHDDLFIYPPLAYLTHALFMGLLSPLYPWPTFHQLILDIGQTVGQPDLSRLLYLLKLPYLVADILCLLVLARLVDIKHRFSALLLWAFNPVTIYASYMMSQFDIYIALFILLCLLFAKQNKLPFSAISLGLAAAFKPFPLVLLPFLGIGFKEKVKLVSLGLLIYLITLLPYLASPGFRLYALLASQSDKLLYAKLMVSGSQYLPLFIVGLGLLLWWNFFKPRSLPLWGWLSTPLLLFYSVTHFHPQWFVWTTPFLLLFLIFHKKTVLPITVLFVCYILIVFSFEPSLNFGLFNINFSLQKWLPDQTISLVRGCFAATSLAIILLTKDAQSV